MNDLLKDLLSEFTDAEYAHAYMESHTVSRIAAQIHALRKQRNWSQEQLAERAGIAQETISKLESADFRSLTLKTLQKFCRAFDVDVRISFEPFSKGILDVVNLKIEKLKVLPRTEDLAEFKHKSMHSDKDGVWQAIEGNDFVGVHMIYQVPAYEEVNTRAEGEWQNLSSANSCMGAC